MKLEDIEELWSLLSQAEDPIPHNPEAFLKIRQTKAIFADVVVTRLIAVAKAAKGLEADGLGINRELSEALKELEKE